MPTTPTTTTPDDTPPHPTQSIRQFPHSNGTSKPGYHHRRRHQPTPSTAAVVYKECLKNFAATLGGHALDGCGEFMPSAAASREDSSLFCAACDCHRSFHRREVEEFSPFVPSMGPYFSDSRRPGRFSSSHSPPPPPPHHPAAAVPSYHPPPQTALSLSTGGQDDQQVPNQLVYAVPTPLTPRDAKSEERDLNRAKRFRTKFTREQKERMCTFAEGLGWKMQKCNQALLENFCKEIGVARGVLKVWMHNNKNTLGRKESNNSPDASDLKNADENAHGHGGELSRHENAIRFLDVEVDQDNHIGSLDQTVASASGIGSTPSSA